MLSETARASTMAESRYRIDAPNSRQRVVHVISLDPRSETLLTRLSADDWGGARFLTAAHEDPPTVLGNRFTDLSGRPVDLVAEVAGADLVVTVADADANDSAGDEVGAVCRVNGVTAVALKIEDVDRGVERRGRASAQPCVVVSTTTSAYVGDMLAALRA